MPHGRGSEPGDAGLTGLPTRVGQFGLLLASWGTVVFAAVAPVSIAAQEIAWGIVLFGLLLAFATRRLDYRTTPLDIPLIVFIGVEFLAVLFAVDRRASLRGVAGDWSIVFLPVFAQALRNSRQVARAFRVLLVSSSIVAAYAVWQVFGGQDLLRHRPLETVGRWYIATGFFGHHLTYGGIVLLTSLLAFVLLVAGKPGARARLLLVLVTLLQLGGVLASSARTAWTGVAAGIVATGFAARGRARRLIILLFALGAVGALALAPIRMRLGAFFSFRSDPRVRLWETALRMWSSRPILGTGPGTIPAPFPRFQVPGEYMSTVHPHNDALNILVQFGVVGFIAFALLWVRYFRSLTGAWRILPPDDPRRPLLFAGIVLVSALFVGSMGQCFLSDETVGALFWFCAAAGIAVAREVHAEIPRT